ncbi:2TM domain-containing protein [Maribacter sp. PR1]|uniref:2TM domain-containing protein n=1 Tax=Maribacter cobaltidurans TaxID=1178778 RepID=A0ABU7IUZ8_9FLAO|nr:MULTISPECIES: 2TM domain-containing protein [Maribacter]MDC6389421.1 2TM domain-containing protein [Maribacter sp. PR1]MEE1976810.1 2TM domain-containing protein [Maribacter cobaltidurans]
MELENNSKNTKLKLAHKRLEELKGFYTHLTIYLVINTVLLILKFIGNSYYGETFMGPVWHFSTFATWFFWGIGLFFHGMKVFYGRTLFSKNWEERQLQKFLKEDEKKNN